jgi:hypothetical protein
MATSVRTIELAIADINREIQEASTTAQSAR